MGTEVPVSSIEGSNRSGGTQQHRSVLRPVEVPNSRTECSTGPCASIGQGSTEGVDFEADGSNQGANGPEVIHEISLSPEEALLG